MQNKVNKVVGYILISPALFSVFCFFMHLFTNNSPLSVFSTNILWTGFVSSVYGREGGVGAYTSALPIYFGLMALAGAYLIKDNKS
jgi:hypothetical protein